MTDPYLPYVSRVPLAWPDTDGPSAHWLDGTLLFVDVAGFTALSERLSRTGRAGAEELTELLDGAFARLLATGYEDGGSLLSFGGDALLLFFGGNDHERRAAHAAGVIKRKPAEIGALKTTVGQVRLRLSMGAHSGRFLFLVSGDESRVLLLLGHDTTTTVRLEQRAAGGQVMLGRRLADAVPEAAGPLEEGAALLLRTPRPPLVGNPQPPGDPLTRPERFLSPPLRTHIAGRPTSEHRPVAVGFLQIRGTDQLLATDEDAAVAAVDEVVLATQRAATEYGVTLLGSDVDADGAKLILVAGAPTATGHAEERLLRACRDALDTDTPLALRAGVTSGHVFVGDVGPAYRRAFTVMGERVNLAARLMASAERGELRTTPKVVAASSTSFRTTELEPLRLKGIAEPVPAVAVGQAIGEAHRDAASVLLGRDGELAVARAVLHRCLAGAGGTIEVVGDAGSGKSAFVTALLSGIDVPTLHAAAVPYESETAFGLVRRLLRHLLVVDTEAEPEHVGTRIAEVLQGLSPQDLGLLLMAADAVAPADVQVQPVVEDDLLVPRLARAVRHTLERLVTGPGVLVVEDLQWADPPSAMLFRAVADHLDEHPWLLCATRRADVTVTAQSLLGDATTVALAPLDDGSAAELVHQLTDDFPLSPHQVKALVARSGGNPLFLTELVRFAREGAELPESVEAVVNARLDALPGYLRKMLRQAAVLGPQLDLDLLADVAGFVPDREEWRELTGVLERVGSRAVFVNEMYRDVAYSALPYRERRDLHRAAGRALQARSSTDVELLAFHAAQAHDNEMTWRYAVEAGVRNAARGAHEQAVVSFRRALIAHERGALGAPEETGAVRVLLGDALVRAGRPREATASYKQARHLSDRGLYGDPLLSFKEASARVAVGQLASAQTWIRRGLDRATGPGELSTRLQLLELRAGVSIRLGHYASAQRTLRSLLDLTEGTSHRSSNAHAHSLMHIVLYETGDPRRVEHRTQALAIYEELGDVQGLAKVLNNLGNDAFHECRWDDALAYLERSRQCEQLDANDVGAAISDSNMAEILVDQGRYGEAHDRLVRALRTFRAEDFLLGVAEVLCHLARVETRRGNGTEAARHLSDARAAMTKMGALMLLPDVQIREAELSLTLGDVGTALEQLEEMATSTDVREELRLGMSYLRGVAAGALGDTAQAEGLLRSVVAAEQGTHVLRTAFARHSLATLLARRGDPEADAHRFAAIETLRALGVCQFPDLLAGGEPVVITVPPGVVDLTDRRAHAAAV